MPARVDELRSLLVGREGVRQRRLLGLAVAIGGTLGLLLVGHQIDLFAAPGWVAVGLFGVGVSVPAAINGHRRGGILVSWVASALGAFPLALAFAPSGPVTMPLNAILVKAAWWTAVLALVLGSVFHGVGMMLRWAGVTRD
jgi:hypothetical protein